MDRVRHELRIGGREWSVWASAQEEPDLEGVTDPEAIPYWTVLWESAIRLAHWVAAHPESFQERVLEVGCGAGLPGLVAASRGAELTQTDRFPQALELAAENARVNGLEGVAREVGDWRAWRVAGQWPVILGADLLYERALQRPLLGVLERALEPGGTVYLADPGRPMSAGFPGLAESAGWAAGRSGLPSPQGGEISLWILRRAAADSVRLRSGVTCITP